MSGSRRRPRPRLCAAALLVVAAATATALPVSAATEGATVLPEVPVTATDARSELAYTSPELAADPTDGNFVVAASRLDNPFSCDLEGSGDGGRSWVPLYPILHLPEGAERCYAPEVAFDGAGTLYFLFVGLHGIGNQPMGAFLATSSDRGHTFSKPAQVLGAERYMVRMAIDTSMGSPGRLHLVWLQAMSPPGTGALPPPPNPIMAAHSDDGGRTFSTPVQVSDPARARVVAPALALGPDHAVHVLYYDLGDDARDYQGLEGPAWEGRWSLLLSSSRDGGDHFATGTVVDDGIVPPERVMLIFTMAPASLAADGAGRVYAAWTDARHGDWDVLLRRSLDGGARWQPPVRLNDDPEGDGRHQYMPRLAVSPGDRLDAVFYDRRGDPANVRNDVYCTWSADGGASFAADLRITSESFDSRKGTRYPIPSARGMHEFGSRLGLLSRDSSMLAAWTDTRNNRVGVQQDVFATEVDLSGTPPDRSLWLWVVGAAFVVVALAVPGGVVATRGRASRRRSPDAVRPARRAAG